MSTGIDVVVGVDGHAAGRRAVRWAAVEAVRRDARLSVVSAYTVAWPPEAFGVLTQWPQNAGEAGASIVAEAVAQARTVAPSVDVGAAAVWGDPAAHLIDRARTAAVVVVGKRRRGELAGVLLGSVSQRVVTGAAGTVVVVRGRTDTGGDPVVVGVDGSPSAPWLLERAFGQADRSDCPLIVVHCVKPSNPPRGRGIDQQWPPSDQTVAATARVDLDAALVPWREQYPGVAVKALVVPRDPVETLVRISAIASLLIVGHGGRRPHNPVLTRGATCRHLVHHADCPVMLMRRCQDPPRSEPPRRFSW